MTSLGPLLFILSDPAGVSVRWAMQRFDPPGAIHVRMFVMQRMR